MFGVDGGLRAVRRFEKHRRLKQLFCIELCNRLDATAMPDQGKRHDQRRGQDDHEQHALIEGWKYEVTIFDSMAKKRRTVINPRGAMYRSGMIDFDQQKQKQSDRIEQRADYDAFHHNMPIEQYTQTHGHTKQDEKERPNHKRAFQG